MASITMSVEDFTAMTERRVLAEMKIKELEAKIDLLTVSTKKKEQTPEQLEAIKAKRSEAGKKAAAKRAEKLAAKKEEERLALISKLREEIRSESEADSACSETASEVSVESRELV